MRLVSSGGWAKQRAIHQSRRMSLALALLLGWTFLVYADEVIPVRTQTLAELAIYPESAAPAVSVSLNNSAIASQVDALVLDIPVRVGDNVKAGAVLVQLSCRDFELDRTKLQAERQAAQAKLELSQWQLKQAETLAQQQTLPEEQVQEKRSQLAVLRGDLAAHAARIEATERQITHCTVKAPFAGVITERLISIGQFASRGTALVRLLDISHPEVSAQVSSRETPALQNSKSLVFEHNGEDYPLHCRTVLPAIHTETGTQEVRLDFIGRKAEPGAAGRLLWRDKVMHVPAELLVKRGEQLGLFINQTGTAHFHALPDAQSGRPAAIALPVDTQVIVTGQFALNEGMAIKENR
ncbi:MAG: efflux RND transporter periplasmic adaptor subunit [Methylobacter sp.]|nr:efflux RND transporter periplasmic adaptor subunit [Methylobacter sp.]